ncbi:MAG: hypothetical protein GQ570_01170 [Helicobacteraceae bacterium]|nr:hypothetical protein [Helicobacteraceae bacterium]
MDQKQKEEIKKSAKKRLQKAGFVFGKPDAISFMLKVESINITNIEVINVQLSLGEEIITKRHENIESFALTYFANDFLEAEDPYDDTLESINFLISEFIDAYHDDNEQ